MMRPIVVALCACVALSSPALAGPLPKDKVPDPLKSWTAWALHGHEGLQCPTLLGNDVADDDIGTEAAGCKFVTRLELSLDAKSGRFSESARSFVDGFVPLPGGDEHWPNDVKVDGKGGAVIARDGAPVLWLTAGDHVITGTFAWTELPESIAVPPETGLVSLTLRGKSVPFPVLEDSGLLWLQREGEDEAAEENRVELTVFRQIVDDVPTRVITRLKLEISGKNREVLLGRALLDGFVPLSLDSPLPARLEPDGRLRVQVRPGTFRVSIEARHDGPLQKLALEAQPEGQQWAPEEIWVYSTVPSLRLAEVQGLPQIDAAQTRLDDDWKRLPAYRVRPGESLTFAEQRRGDADPAPDKVDLTRTIWLDFDGKGATSIDALSGTLSRSWRLEMQAPQQLGRAMIGGEDQLITRTSEAAAPGVEVRSGRFAMSAESRLDGSVSALPAVGWDHDVNSLSVNLNMPPGWRLVHAGGVDEVSQTWLQRWSLLDFFVVLMVALAAGKLFGVRFGILAFVTLGLSLPEGAPRWAWLAPLVAEALLRVVPAGIAAKLLNIARVATWTVLAILLVPFSVTHLRSGLTPSVENRVDESAEDASISYYRSNSLIAPGSPAPTEAGNDADGVFAAPQAEAIVPFGAVKKMKVAHKAAARDEGALGQALGAALGGVVSGSGQIGSLGRGSGSAKLGSQQVYAQNAQRQMQNIDPQAIVQTGTGMPNWTWRQITLHWSGPVEKSAKLVLWLLPPWANLVLSFLRVLLLAALFAVVILRRREGPPEEGPSSPGAPGSSTFAATAAVIVLLLPAGARADADVHGMPSDDLLTQLRQKLTERPACMPDCAQSPKLVVDASGGQLKLKFEIAAAAQLAVPLPGSAAQWTPERVLLDGAPAKALLRSGDSLYVLVPEGLHTAELSGPIPPRDSVQLALPLRPHRVEAHLEGFTLDGLHPDGTTEESLQLTRKQRGTPQGKLEPGQLPAFAEVRRTLVLGLTWEVQTEVVRRSPAATPATLEVPLLPGESITSAGVRVEKGKAIVTLTPHTGSVEWHSSLSEAPTLTLTAPPGVPWTESWTLVVSPIWHVDVSGLAPILLPATEGRPREFHPYPGEKLSLAITRPAAVPGQSLTVQSSHLVITPGARSLDAALELALSSSRGAPFTVTLPEGATVQSLALDRVEQPLRQEGRKATITVPPGEHRLTFTWREPAGLSILFHTPRPELGLATVNASVEVRLPTSRWTLLLGGPHLGPAVLFWSFLVAMLLAAFALSRVPNVPVTTLQWFLLAIGLSQVEIVPAAIVAAWLIALGLRRAHGQTIAGRAAFNLTQLVLVGLTIASALILFESIHRGLLGAPDMQIEGNGSDASRLRWFSDRTPQLLPGAWVLSVPLIVYKLAMLVWALWLASSLLRWLPWAWGGFSQGGLWRKAPPRAEKTAGSAAPPAPSPGASPPAAPATIPIEAKPAD